MPHPLDNPLDRAVAGWMLAERSAGLTRVCTALMWVGTPGPGFVVFGVVVLAASLLRRRPLTVLAVAAAVQVTAWVNWAVKHLVQRPRPGDPYVLVPAVGWSMPSTAVAVTTAGLVVLWRLAPASRGGRRALATLFVLLDLAVAFAVVYLGTHWVTDTVVGALEGAGMGLLANRLCDLTATRWAAHRGRGGVPGPARWR